MNIEMAPNMADFSLMVYKRITPIIVNNKPSSLSYDKKLSSKKEESSP